MIAIEFAAAALPSTGALVLFAWRGPTMEGSGPSGLWQQADAACGGAIGRAIAAAEFTGKKGQTATLFAPGAGLSRVLLVGLGKAADHTPRGMEEAGGTAAAALGNETSASIAVDGMPAAHACHAALGALLKTYRFDLYRTKEKADAKPKLATLTLLTDDVAAAQAAGRRWRRSRGERRSPGI